MKWLFHLISIASVVLSGVTLGTMVSDIQLIIAVQFATLAVLSFNGVNSFRDTNGQGRSPRWSGSGLGRPG